jgi:hypothetical protein
MRAFKVMPKALRILAKKLTHLACNSRCILSGVSPQKHQKYRVSPLEPHLGLSLSAPSGVVGFPLLNAADFRYL